MYTTIKRDYLGAYNALRSAMKYGYDTESDIVGFTREDLAWREIMNRYGYSAGICAIVSYNDFHGLPVSKDWRDRVKTITTPAPKQSAYTAIPELFGTL